MTVSHPTTLAVDHHTETSVITALRTLFEDLADPRGAQGIRHELATVLTITVLAALAGARNFREAGDRAAELPDDLLLTAGARVNPHTNHPKPPSGSTISRIAETIDADMADARVGAWIAACVRAHRAHHNTTPATIGSTGWLDGLAIDGKTVHDSAGPTGVNVQLFSALLHQEKVVIAQIAVPEHTTEVTQVARLLDPVDLTDTVVTADAAHTIDPTATYLAVTRKSHYCLPVKENQPKLLRAIVSLMPRAAVGSAHHTTDERVGGHRVVREIWVVPATGITFPRARQVYRIRRQTYDLLGHRIAKEIVHGITNVTPDEATAEQLLALNRGHWGVESNHWIRDVVFREDHQHARTRTGVQVMAMIRNLALAILRLSGIDRLTRTLQRIAADRSLIPLLLAAFPIPESAM
jgi:predicted transposase YbfD/YdcC